MNNLTDRVFWKNYWENYQYKKVADKTFFDNYLPQNLTGTGKSFIEIGGFPGTMSIYFNKKFGFDVTLLDFYIDHEMVTKMESINGIAPNTIHCIESDFFSFNSEKKYDFVFSLGFIEHFDDTFDVIKRHAELLSNQGDLLIILPNFLGLNGWLQKTFDRKNFEAHNLNSMKISNLQSIIEKLNLSETKIEYTSKPMIWIEPKATFGNKVARIFVKLLSYILKLFPIKSKILSPYIVISAKR